MASEMNILGVDAAIIGVVDLAAARRFFTEFGLTEVEPGAKGATFETLDGSAMILRMADDPALPPANAPAPNIRETVWGVGYKLVP